MTGSEVGCQSHRVWKQSNLMQQGTVYVGYWIETVSQVQLESNKPLIDYVLQLRILVKHVLLYSALLIH